MWGLFRLVQCSLTSGESSSRDHHITARTQHAADISENVLDLGEAAITSLADPLIWPLSKHKLEVVSELIVMEQCQLGGNGQ